MTTGEVVQMSEGRLGKRRALKVLAAASMAALLAACVTYGTAAAGEGSRYVEAEDARFIGGVGKTIGSVHTLFNLNASKQDGDVDGFASFEQQPFNGPGSLPIAQPAVGNTVFPHLQGKVTCLDIRGNKAGFAFLADVGSTATYIGQYVTGTIEDNGRGSADKISLGPIAPVPAAGPSAAPTSCAPGSASSNLSQGNAKIGRGDGEDLDGIDRTDY